MPLEGTGDGLTRRDDRHGSSERDEETNERDRDQPRHPQRPASDREQAHTREHAGWEGCRAGMIEGRQGGKGRGLRTCG